jgi:phosphoribosyl 1,2-cyclic phosphodiesterase
MKFISLGSGSSGNCYYINTANTGIIIDLGLGIRTFKKLYKDYGLSLAEIQGILVTHNHTDHTKAIGPLSNEFHIPVYTTEAVHEGIMKNIYLSKKVHPSEKRIICHYETFEIGALRITAFPVPHDSHGNNGYIIEAEGKTLVLITDIGHVTEEIKQAISKAEHLIVESNYDLAMLESGKYPNHLKRRIKGPYGHISNTETAELLAENLNKERIKNIWLCHLSEENNTPELARSTTKAALTDKGFNLNTQLSLISLPRRTPYGIIEV